MLALDPNPLVELMQNSRFHRPVMLQEVRRELALRPGPRNCYNNAEPTDAGRPLSCRTSLASPWSPMTASSRGSRSTLNRTRRSVASFVKRPTGPNGRILVVADSERGWWRVECADSTGRRRTLPVGSGTPGEGILRERSTRVPRTTD